MRCSQDVPVDHQAFVRADVARQWAYFSEHLTEPLVEAYIDAGVWSSAYLVPLHQAGCSPDDVRQFVECGATVSQALDFARLGWTPCHVTAADLPVAVTYGYLHQGVTDPRLMRRLNRARATPVALHNLTADARSVLLKVTGEITTAVGVLRGRQPIADHDFTIAGAASEIRFEIRAGTLRCCNPADLEEERIWTVLGGGAASPAAHLVDEWARGIDADWAQLGQLIGLSLADARSNRLRWLCTLVEAPFSSEDGPPPPPPRNNEVKCLGCERRQAHIAVRNTVIPGVDDRLTPGQVAS